MNDLMLNFSICFVKIQTKISYLTINHNMCCIINKMLHISATLVPHNVNAGICNMHPVRPQYMSGVSVLSVLLWDSTGIIPLSLQDLPMRQILYVGFQFAIFMQ